MMANQDITTSNRFDASLLHEPLRLAHDHELKEADSSRDLSCIWGCLALVLRQQISQDLLLMWQCSHHLSRLSLAAASPALTPLSTERITPGRMISELACGRLEAVAHVQCREEECGVEAALYRLGALSGITVSLGGDESPFLLTFGFRSCWQFVSHHMSAVSACIAHIVACRDVAFKSSGARRWWEQPAVAPKLWRQPWRPSVFRTVHDLNDVLIEIADQYRPAEMPGPQECKQQVASIAHSSAQLMERLEDLYYSAQTQCLAEELLAEASMIVRSACYIVTGRWLGCFLVAPEISNRPVSRPAEMRRLYIDRIIAHVSAAGGWLQ